ncbi:MAG: hypothetical protein HY936_06705 [Nitrosomonadales bacterium]|nr:hypothetical protein [Nitrosomonadales bacterium]
MGARTEAAAIGMGVAMPDARMMTSTEVAAVSAISQSLNSHIGTGVAGCGGKPSACSQWYDARRSQRITHDQA